MTSSFNEPLINNTMAQDEFINMMSIGPGQVVMIIMCKESDTFTSEYENTFFIPNIQFLFIHIFIIQCLTKDLCIHFLYVCKGWSLFATTRSEKLKGWMRRYGKRRKTIKFYCLGWWSSHRILIWKNGKDPLWGKRNRLRRSFGTSRKSSFDLRLLRRKLDRTLRRPS